MARGWESKSVEAQMEESVAAETANKRTVLTPEQMEKQRKHASLMLSRSRILEQLDQSTNDRYSELLRQTLAALDTQIAMLVA